MMKQFPKVLSIAGSDSGGGAGIQADLKTISALGCYGMTVITAVTAQNTLGVKAVHPVPSEIVAQQIHAVVSDMKPDAIKIGMLANGEIVQTVVKHLKGLNVPVVLDPVFVSTSGKPLLDQEAVAVMVNELFSFATLITPNIPEVEKLLGIRIGCLGDMKEAAELLGRNGAPSVLVKGGHLNGKQACDVLFHEGNFYEFSGPRIETKNNHGTGCTLSSAIASYLAKGEELPQAICHAKEYLLKALNAGKEYCYGEGNGPVHHFFDVLS